ncbi:hypothetical protein [Beijerinckia sp. L45]|uniref:hypothetical protein n=1 Tax=Beijerinckia sp. L45 TaxID=1641855 RepID=UPI00131B836A|nr:hypothetical protein [Beijerinckia sp. L45]
MVLPYDPAVASSDIANDQADESAVINKLFQLSALSHEELDHLQQHIDVLEKRQDSDTQHHHEDTLTED